MVLWSLIKGDARKKVKERRILYLPFCLFEGRSKGGSNIMEEEQREIIGNWAASYSSFK